MKQVIVVAVHSIAREEEYTHAYWLPFMKYGGLSEYADYLVSLKGESVVIVVNGEGWVVKSLGFSGSDFELGPLAGHFWPAIRL